MSVGAMCFTSSGSNGGCWVVLVFFLGNLLFLKKGFFSPQTTYAKRKSLRNLHQKKSLVEEKKTRFTAKKNHAPYATKKKRDLRFSPQLSYAFTGKNHWSC